MADAMQVAVDKERAIRALEHLGVYADAYIQTACSETAQKIADEARRRIARSNKPHTGTDVPTWTKIHWERSRDKRGYVVMAYDTGGHGKAGRTQQHHVDLYLEFGTMNMYAKPFLHASARLEEGPHFRRVEDALDRATRNAEAGG